MEAKVNFTVKQRCIKKNPANRRHLITCCVQIVAPIPKTSKTLKPHPLQKNKLVLPLVHAVPNPYQGVKQKDR